MGKNRKNTGRNQPSGVFECLNLWELLLINRVCRGRFVDVNLNGAAGLGVVLAPHHMVGSYHVPLGIRAVPAIQDGVLNAQFIQFGRVLSLSLFLIRWNQHCRGTFADLELDGHSFFKLCPLRHALVSNGAFRILLIIDIFRRIENVELLILGISRHCLVVLPHKVCHLVHLLAL